mmetsp:Transcript_40879/g.64858  ORF Transcript_40879/g.64858 Transcript_40879/m.64858 type:complete len:123 (+) Transcript_40879:69-437(+)
MDACIVWIYGARMLMLFTLFAAGVRHESSAMRVGSAHFQRVLGRSSVALNDTSHRNDSNAMREGEEGETRKTAEYIVHESTKYIHLEKLTNVLAVIFCAFVLLSCLCAMHYMCIGQACRYVF